MKNLKHRLMQSNTSSEISSSYSETDTGKSFDGYNKYQDIKNVWAKTHSHGHNTIISYLLQFFLVSIGFLSLFTLIKCTVWLKQQADLKMEGYLSTSHTIIFPEIKPGDLINYAADYNKAYIDKENTLINLHNTMNPIITTNSPQLLLSDDNSPGKCWGFRGTYGYVTILLDIAVLTTKFTIQHVNIAEHRKAPRDFCVYNVESSQIDECLLLGCYSLSLDSQQDWSATFECQDEDK